MTQCGRPGPFRAVQNRIWGTIRGRDGKSPGESVHTGEPLRRRLGAPELEICGPEESRALTTRFHLPCGNCCQGHREERGAHRPRKRKPAPTAAGMKNWRQVPGASRVALIRRKAHRKPAVLLNSAGPGFTEFFRPTSKQFLRRVEHLHAGF